MGGMIYIPLPSTQIKSDIHENTDGKRQTTTIKANADKQSSRYYRRKKNTVYIIQNYAKI